MRAANWKDYELIDTGSGERLERWGDILLIRPDPQIIWKSEKKDPRWRSAHARYKRSFLRNIADLTNRGALTNPLFSSSSISYVNLIFSS